MGTFGIDLGTTNSCIAKLDQNGNPVVIQNYSDGSYTLASAVYFDKESDAILVGETAKEYEETSPERLIQFAKREIGRREAGSPKGHIYNIDGKEFTPIDISALILKKLKEMAEEQGEEVTDVIITCPAYFGFEEREATRKAGELVKFNVLDLIDEPTAAAVNYCYREFQEDQIVAVYDLGGGTFDVSILEMSVVKNESGRDINRVKQLASAGNDLLGGKDWDDILYNIMISKYCSESETDASDLEPETRQKIRGNVEKIKKVLSLKDNANVRIKSELGPVNIVVTKEEFESATSHLVEQTMSLFEKALSDIGDKCINKVLLVGGSTYMPMIRNAVEEKFPGIVQIEDPEQAVAKGAAVYATILMEPNPVPDPVPGPVPGPGPEPGPDHKDRFDDIGSITEGIVVPQSPRSFGPGVLDDVNGLEEYICDNLIKKGAELPAVATKKYGTIIDNQQGIRIRVFENMSLNDKVRPCIDRHGNTQETDEVDMMKYLGVLEMELPPNLPRGTEIEVTFLIDASGVHVTAKNMATGEEKTESIKYATIYNDEETEQKIKDIDGIAIMD